MIVLRDGPGMVSAVSVPYSQQSGLRPDCRLGLFLQEVADVFWVRLRRTQKTSFGPLRGPRSAPETENPRGVGPAAAGPFTHLAACSGPLWYWDGLGLACVESMVW
ncbi:hypothetical protein Ddc_08278 [Ditylenchus destructor]|nr:hypothetical protein Ddc_08278 [Ditylenchus destructor]